MLGLWALGTTRSVVPKSTALALWFSQFIGPIGDGAEHDRAVADGPTAVLSFSQANRLTHQGRVDVDEPAVEFDLSIVANPAYVLVSIIRRAQNAVKAAR